MKTTRLEPSFPGLLQDFFCQHMMAERGLSAQTVASYRDTFRLLLRFAQARLGILPSNLKLADLDAELILAFLNHLEQVRGAGIRTRNTRLAAVRSFMRYAAGRVPTCLGVVQSVLAVPTKRFDRSAKEVDLSPTSPLFPNRFGQIMSRSGVEKRLKLAVRQAVKEHPSLSNRRISPHTFRHTTAMHLLQASVDITVVALWLGHESPATAHHYVEADLTMKQRALDKLNAPFTRSGKYRPSDRLLAFLEAI